MAKHRKLKLLIERFDDQSLVPNGAHWVGYWDRGKPRTPVNFRAFGQRPTRTEAEALRDQLIAGKPHLYEKG